MKLDWNDIAALEKAMEEKYGKDSTIDPRSCWNPDKEKEYIRQSKENYRRDLEEESKEEKTNLGFSVKGKLFSSGLNHFCNKCQKYSINPEDDFYLNKFKCCYYCFIKHYEGRYNG